MSKTEKTKDYRVRLLGMITNLLCLIIKKSESFSKFQLLKVVDIFKFREQYQYSVFLFLVFSRRKNCWKYPDRNKLTHLFPLHLFSNPWIYQKFWCFQGGRERVHWELMGTKSDLIEKSHWSIRSTHAEVFCKISVSKFTEKHLRQSCFLIK